MVNKGLLHGAQRAILLGQSFDRAQLCTVGEYGECEARADHLTIHQDGAGTAYPHTTPFHGARETQSVAQTVDQQALHRHLYSMFLAVHPQGDCLSHGVLPSRLWIAW